MVGIFLDQHHRQRLGPASRARSAWNGVVAGVIVSQERQLNFSPTASVTNHAAERRRGSGDILTDLRQVRAAAAGARRRCR